MALFARMPFCEVERKVGISFADLSQKEGRKVNSGSLRLSLLINIESKVFDLLTLLLLMVELLEYCSFPGE